MPLDESSSNWKQLYIDAILEPEKDRVLPRIHAAKVAICDRLEELGTGGSAVERIALNQAMKAITELQEVYDGEGRTLPHHSLRRPWQVVAQELTAQTNPERVVELSKELIHALDQTKVVGKYGGHDSDANVEPTNTNHRSDYEGILDKAVTFMRSDYASLQMLYPERGSGGELRLLAFRGFNPEAARFWEWVRADSKSTCGIALCYKSRVIAADIATCNFIAGSEDQRIYLETGIRACQTTPLIGQSGNVVGMISTHWRTPHQPSEEDFRLFDILARQTADLIESCGADGKLPSSVRHYPEGFRTDHLVCKYCGTVIKPGV